MPVLSKLHLLHCKQLPQDHHSGQCVHMLTSGTLQKMYSRQRTVQRISGPMHGLDRDKLWLITFSWLSKFPTYGKEHSQSRDWSTKAHRSGLESLLPGSKRDTIYMNDRYVSPLDCKLFMSQGCFLIHCCQEITSA